MGMRVDALANFSEGLEPVRGFPLVSSKHTSATGEDRYPKGRDAKGGSVSEAKRAVRPEDFGRGLSPP
jgi:hypothetical protein